MREIYGLLRLANPPFGHSSQVRTQVRFCKLALTCEFVWPGLKTISLPKVNLTKPRKLLNPELSNETQRCDHSNESSRWVLSNGGVHVVTEDISCFCKFFPVLFVQRNMTMRRLYGKINVYKYLQFSFTLRLVWLHLNLLKYNALASIYLVSRSVV